MTTTERYYGYCFPVPDGWHTPAVTLTGAAEAFRYTQLHGKGPFFREIRITDGGDELVVQMIDGKYVWPVEWAKFNVDETIQ